MAVRSRVGVSQVVENLGWPLGIGSLPIKSLSPGNMQVRILAANNLSTKGEYMFGFEMVAIQIAQQVFEIKHEEWLNSLPPDMAASIRKKEKKEREEAKKDKQHKELCAALHASGKTKTVYRNSSGSTNSSYSSDYPQGLVVGFLLGEMGKL